MWLLQNVKLHVWVTFVVCILFLLDSAGLGISRKRGEGFWNAYMISSRSVSRKIQFVPLLLGTWAVSLPTVTRAHATTDDQVFHLMAVL